jgi:hypothetical protein
MVCAYIHGSDAFVVFDLGTNLVCDCIHPWDSGEVEVCAEYFGERFGFDEGLVQVPDKAVTYSEGICFEFDTDRD